MNYKIIRNRCSDLEISTKELCRKISISRTSFYKYVNNDVVPTISVLQKIADVLSLNVEDLLFSPEDQSIIIANQRKEIQRMDKIIDELIEKMEIMRLNNSHLHA